MLDTATGKTGGFLRHAKMNYEIVNFTFIIQQEIYGLSFKENRAY